MKLKKKKKKKKYSNCDFHLDPTTRNSYHHIQYNGDVIFKSVNK